MLVDVNKLNSHPDKNLFTHVNGVIANVNELTKNFGVAKWAELVAIFHDLGKINPNFQDKLKKKDPKEYAHHAYFSAFAFHCAFMFSRTNFTSVKKWLEVEKLTISDLIALTVIIAKHHGHLLDLKPEKESVEKNILSEDESKNLFAFLESRFEELPINEFANYYMNGLGIEIENFNHLLLQKETQHSFLNKFIFKRKLSESSLDFFLDTQFAFASLIYADKSDAANFPTIRDSKKEVKEFCKIYPSRLDAFLETLNPNSRLNELRTSIRKEAVLNLNNHLKKGKRVFELTSPTGSGKTLMLLSLAAKILEEKGDYRVIFALPFLSITEQVEAEVLKIFKEEKGFVQRIDSKSKNERLEEIQKKLDENPSEELIKELGSITFKENVFAHPFIITTFVRLFETILSNRNATLLKLPNFSKCIFLLDEIQSLPPRLYTFFVAYLDKFCEKFDSYAVVSTATQPNFELPIRGSNADKAKIFFSNYNCPAKLLHHEKYFSDDVFNRYKIHFEKNEINLEELKNKVLNEDNSVLIILNTIDDSRDFYELLIEVLSKDEVVLLNTHFTPNDRKKKIYKINKRLKENNKIIAISTQLIEAGVDIDFPILYRDFAPISSIVQSAGRCNRNGRLDFGKVVLFKLYNRGTLRAKIIYGQGKDKEIWRITTEAIKKLSLVEEKELLKTQQFFFDSILNRLNFALHSQKKYDLKLNFIQDITDCMFQKIGKFQLIDEQEYGESVRYFVAENENDDRFEKLIKLDAELKEIIKDEQKDWSKITITKGKVKDLLRDMSGQIVQIRLKKPNSVPDLANNMDYLGLYYISPESYSDEKGVLINEVCGII